MWVNGGPGWAVYVGDELTSVFAFDVEGDRIRGCYVVRNPDKLAAVGRDLREAAAPTPSGQTTGFSERAP